jgi:TolB-like protein
MRPLLIILGILLCSGCATTPWSQHEPKPFRSNAQLVASSHDAVSRLLAKMPADRPLDPRQPIIVASLVNIDDLTSSRLGRIVSEQLMTRLVESGYAVTELKLRESIYIRHKEGELMLSREIPEISRKHAAQAVLVGTYAQSINNLYLTIKLVGVVDNLVIASHDFVIPMDSEIRSLFWTKPL